MENNKIISIIITVVTFPLWGGMILAALILLLSIYLIMWSIPAAAGIGAAALTAVGTVGAAGSFVLMTESAGAGFIQLGISLASLGAAILLAMLAWEAGKKIVRLTSSTLKKITHFKKKAGANNK